MGAENIYHDKTVSFSQMKDGTREDYELLRDLEGPYIAKTADRILTELHRQAEETLSGYKITRLGHALQSATRALSCGADIDWIVSALLHDIGDGLAPENHDRFSAEIIRPYVREECTWVVEHHGAFQMVYYAHHYGWDENLREQYADSPYYQSCIDFCEYWDQSSFDPDYHNKDLDFFTPMVKEIFSRPSYDEAYIRPGVVVGIPK